jgi:hypothetical protein
MLRTKIIVIYSMLLVTGSQSKNISCLCLVMAQWRSLVGQSLEGQIQDLGKEGTPALHFRLRFKIHGQF